MDVELEEIRKSLSFMTEEISKVAHGANGSGQAPESACKGKGQED